MIELTSIENGWVVYPIEHVNEINGLLYLSNLYNEETNRYIDVSMYANDEIISILELLFKGKIFITSCQEGDPIVIESAYDFSALDISICGDWCTIIEKEESKSICSFNISLHESEVTIHQDTKHRDLFSLEINTKDGRYIFIENLD